MPISTQCYDCFHFVGNNKCDAFPKGIPRPIYTGAHDHREEFKGDNGIRFESLEEFMKKVSTNSNERLKWMNNESKSQT
jgi:hypothetical protein